MGSIYQCKQCGMIPADQDKAHKYVSNPMFDRCNRCGGKHELVTYTLQPPRCNRGKYITKYTIREATHSDLDTIDEAHDMGERGLTDPFTGQWV